MEELVLDGNSLTIEDLVKVSRFKALKISLSDSAVQNLTASRNWVEKAIHERKIVYGITTGFGSFKSRVIPQELTEELQENLVRSHACGVGEPFAEEVVRATILIRINSLIKGYSGVRREVIDFLIAILNEQIYPFVPEQGSVGSSGDLSPLCHIMLLLLGEGECLQNGKRVPTAQILAEKNIKPLRLQAKEGLALSNGTSVQTAVAALAVYDAGNLIDTADIAASISVQVLMGSEIPFTDAIHRVRNQIGQRESANNIRWLLTGSEIVHSHQGCSRVQDAYSLRCTPQVHGAVRDGFTYAKLVIERELNAATDNPLIFPEFDAAYSGGNFHGEPIGIAMDAMGIAIAEIANLSERRTARLVDPTMNEGLPAFLIPGEMGGVNSGLMIAQYTAAALVSENKVLAHPASVDSIPTSANQEDHVSMGTIAARKCRSIVRNVREVLAIELLCATQAVEFRRPLKLSAQTEKIYEIIRQNVPAITRDRALYLDIEKVSGIIAREEMLKVAYSEISGWNKAKNRTTV